MKNIIYYRIPFGTEEWFKFRSTGINEEESKKYGCTPYPGGIGASEAGMIIYDPGFRPCPQEYYHFKVGTEIQKKLSNTAIIMGKILEPVVKDIWAVWDGTEDGWVNNYEEWKNAEPGDRAKMQVRKARKVNAYLVNKNYPWLFASLDYLASNGTTNVIDQIDMPNGFPVEIKTINGHYANTWEAGIPPYHIIQVQTQMLITEIDYCELAVLVDGRKFICYPIKANKNIQDMILSRTEDFFKKVIKGREYKELMDLHIEKGNVDAADKQKSFIDSLEPDPSSSKGYEEYKRERFREEVPSARGNVKLYNTCYNDKILLSIENIIKKDRQLNKNVLIDYLVKTGAVKIDFESKGEVTYYESKNKNRTLLIKPEEKINKEELEKTLREYLKLVTK